MSLDLNKIRKKQKETNAKSSGGGYWKPEAGRNTIRVFSFDHKVTKEDVKAGLFEKDKLGKMVTELDRQVVRFFSPAPRIASEKELEAWRAKFDKCPKAKKQTMKQSGPQTHWVLNIVDTSAAEPKIVEFAANKTIYNRILGEVLDPDHGEDILGANGRDFVIEYDPEKDGSAKYTVKLRDEKKCEKLPESLEGQVKDYYDPDVYAGLGSGETAKDTSEEEEDESEEEEDEDDLDSDEEDEDDDSSDEDDEESEEEEDSEDEDSDEEEDEEDEDLEDDEDEEEEEEDEKPAKGKSKPAPKAPLKKKK